MRDGVHQLADLRDRIELLEDLPTQRFDMRLAVVDLAAGKLPVTGEVRAVRPQRQQKRSVAFDDGRDDDDRGHFGADGADRHRLDPRDRAVRLDHLCAHIAFVALERIGRRTRRSPR